MIPIIIIRTVPSSLTAFIIALSMVPSIPGNGQMLHGVVVAANVHACSPVFNKGFQQPRQEGIAPMPTHRVHRVVTDDDVGDDRGIVLGGPQ